MILFSFLYIVASHMEYVHYFSSVCVFFSCNIRNTFQNMLPSILLPHLTSKMLGNAVKRSEFGHIRGNIGI